MAGRIPSADQNSQTVSVVDEQKAAEMDREEFKRYVTETIEKVVCLAEEQTKQKLSRELCFHWFGDESERIREEIAEHITQRVYIDADHIYPCVDIGVTDILDDGTLIIFGYVAGYPPGPFQENWTGRDGPFFYITGQKVFDKLG